MNEAELVWLALVQKRGLRISLGRGVLTLDQTAPKFQSLARTTSTVQGTHPSQKFLMLYLSKIQLLTQLL